jgi:hypothetical protein
MPAAKRRGRLLGSAVLIPDDPKRFRRAFALALDGFVAAPSSAAIGVVALDEGSLALEATPAGITFVVPIGHGDGIRGKAGTITRNRREYLDRASAQDQEWLLLSSGYVFSWLHAVATDDRKQTAVSVEKLRELDAQWPVYLDQILADVLNAPLRGDLQPHERDTVPRHIGRLLKHIAKSRGKDFDLIYRAQILARKSRKRRR